MDVNALSRSVDEVVDTLDVEEIELEANKYALTVEEYMQRVTNEIKARLDYA